MTMPRLWDVRCLACDHQPAMPVCWPFRQKVMPQLCQVYARTMYTRSMSEPCQIHASNIPEASHVRSMPELCQKCARSTPELCQHYVRRMQEACQKHTRVTPTTLDFVRNLPDFARSMPQHTCTPKLLDLCKKELCQFYA